VGVTGVFETMRRVGATVPLLEAHIARLGRSARALSIPLPAVGELERLCRERAAVEAAGSSGDAILRLELAATGRVAFDARPLERASLPLCVDIVSMPVGTAGGPHKRADRAFWTGIRARSAAGADDALLVADGQVLEATAANVWARLDGVWVTPPLDGRVLPGIGRAWTLARLRDASVRVAERPIPQTELCRATALMLTNAVYGPRPAVVLGGLVPASIAAAQLPGCLLGWPGTEAPG
jgi:branched-subunit amino acid aminotransferase/4-amino-4-deoxychorismate lyase